MQAPMRNEEEGQSKESDAIEKEIENQNQKFIDMEHKHAQKTAVMSELMVGLAQHIHSRQISLLEMVSKYNESLTMIMKLMSEGDTLHEECRQELQQLKVMNSNLSHDMESLKKEREQISKELKESKSLTDLQQKKFAEAIQKHAMEITSLHIAAVKQHNDYEKLKEQNEKLNAKIIELEAEIPWKSKRKHVHDKALWICVDMCKHSYKYKETLSKQRVVIESLQREIEFKNHKIMEMEHKHTETLTSVHKLVVGLVENINSKERSLLQMECKYNDMVQKLMNERDKLRKDLQLMKNTNANVNYDKEYLKKDDGQITKELDESKALNDLQQNFIEEIENLKKELGDQRHVGSGGDLNTQISTFRNKLKDKMEYLELLENLYSSLVVREQQYRQELHEAREESINSLRGMFRGRSQLGIKRMGELDPKPFQDLYLQKYSDEQWQEKSAKLCSSWEENLKDPTWHPFKKIEVNGILQETLDENDEKLKGLRSECGEVVYKAVTNALMEIEEYNSSGRYAISEIWNWKEGRKATLKEVIQHIIRQLNIHKRKRK